jgi:hypothetical protein
VEEELEERLLEREQLDSLNLGRELESLKARERTHNGHESTHEAERKALVDARVTVMARELAVDVRKGNLDTRAVVLADREKQ